MSISTEIFIRTLLSQKTNMMAYIMFFVGDNESAEDIFQNISIAAYQKCESMNDRDHMIAWLRIAARNECLKTMRNKARTHIRFDSTLIEQLEPHWQQFDQHQPKLQDKLQTCLGRLSPKAKNIVKLKYYEGLRGDVIAETLNMKLNAVYVCLSRIHRWLAECIQTDFSREKC